MAGETTGVVVVVSPAGLVGARAGDSAAWLVIGTGIDDLTAGQRRARLGSGRATPASFERGRADGFLVVGTGGPFNYMEAEKIAETARSVDPTRATEALVELVRLSSGGFHDDAAVVIVSPAGEQRHHPPQTRRSGSTSEMRSPSAAAHL
jgi:hypothetical protein